MKDELRMHAFVCVNERDPSNQRGCCSSKNSLEVMTKLKRRVREMGINDVRINKSGCLNRCEEGIACVIYPQGIWYKISDDDEIINKIILDLEKGIITDDYLMDTKLSD